MYTGLLHTHNMFRWLILIAALLAIIFSLAGWAKKAPWTKKEKLTGLLLLIFMDIQFLAGAALYAFYSPITQAAFRDFGAAMKNSEMRFYAVEHLTMMLIALVLVHIGRAKTKKIQADWKKHRAAVLFFTVALIVILSAIPWSRDLI